MIFMNKIIEKDSTIYIGEEDVNITVNNSCKVYVYQYVVDKDISIEINLNKEGASIEYHYSHINYNDHTVSISVIHNSQDTSSYLYNHGVNVYDKKFSFLVNGTILKDRSNSICNQENQIINLENGKSRICPNLFIDCYDTNSTHSAYIGEFNKEKIFYLESRGLKRSKVYHLLLLSFLVNKTVDMDFDFPDLKKFLEEIDKL